MATIAFDALGNPTGYNDDSLSPPKAGPTTKDDFKKPTSAPARSSADVNRQAPDAPRGSGQASTNTSPQNPADSSKPNPRIWNPLSRFSSYTYCLTLYMVTPEALNYFTLEGKLPSPQGNVNGYVFKIAESGGLSNNDARALTLDPAGDLGPNKAGLDFFIDDLNFDVILVGAGGQKTATIGTNVNFNIIEPIGYTLLTKMMKASAKINSLSPLIQQSPNGSPPNLYQQHYMFGIKFYAYDENGAPISSSDPRAGSDVITEDKYALYTRVFPLKISSVNFKIDGRATVYQVEGITVPHQVAYGKKLGKVQPNTELQGATVGDILGYIESKNPKSLMYQLNETQSDYNKNNNIQKPNRYIIEWVKNEIFDATAIKNSPLATDEEFERALAAMAPVNNVQESNVQRADKSKSVDKNKKLLALSPGTAIPMVIDQVISHSKYVVDSLTKENNSKIETQTKSNSPALLNWFAIHPSVKILGRDQEINDWVYDITYQIVPYQIPYVKSQYVTARAPYYGAVKEYSYLLTGKNTEVVSIDLTYNNLYYVQQPTSTTQDDASKNKKNPSPATPKAPSNSINSTQGGAGVLRNAGMISDSVRSSLYSLADQMTGTLTILGDPDFLMDAVGKRINEATSYGQFYAKSNSIVPYGGQIFIEIMYDVAEDYKNNGLLDLDPSYTLQFYPLETTQQIKSKGLIYKINKVSSNFSKGKFVQTLDIIQVPVSELIIPQQNKNDNQRDESANQSAAETARLNRQNATPRIPPKVIQSGGGGKFTGSGASGSWADKQPVRANIPNATPNDDASVNVPRRGSDPKQGLKELREELGIPPPGRS